MKSTKFPQINHRFEAKDENEVPVPYNELSVFIGEDSENYPCTISCWEPASDSEMFNFLISKKVWLSVSGRGMPPVSLSLVNPFADPESIITRNDALNTVSGAFDILNERFRVLGKGEGFQVADDASYSDFILIDAAMAYIKEDPYFWPFDPEFFNPGDEISNLIKAGQFIAARIDAIRYQNEQTLKGISQDESTGKRD